MKKLFLKFICMFQIYFAKYNQCICELFAADRYATAHLLKLITLSSRFLYCNVFMLYMTFFFLVTPGY